MLLKENMVRVSVCCRITVNRFPSFLRGLHIRILAVVDGFCVVRYRPINDDISACRSGDGCAVNRLDRCNRLLEAGVVDDCNCEIVINCPMNSNDDFFQVTFVLRYNGRVDQRRVNTIQRVLWDLRTKCVAGTCATLPALLRLNRL